MGKGMNSTILPQGEIRRKRSHQRPCDVGITQKGKGIKKKGDWRFPSPWITVPKGGGGKREGERSEKERELFAFPLSKKKGRGENLKGGEEKVRNCFQLIPIEKRRRKKKKVEFYPSRGGKGKKKKREEKK